MKVPYSKLRDSHHPLILHLLLHVQMNRYFQVRVVSFYNRTLTMMFLFIQLPVVAMTVYQSATVSVKNKDKMQVTYQVMCNIMRMTFFDHFRMMDRNIKKYTATFHMSQAL